MHRSTAMCGKCIIRWELSDKCRVTIYSCCGTHIHGPIVEEDIQYIRMFKRAFAFTFMLQVQEYVDVFKQIESGVLQSKSSQQFLLDGPASEAVVFNVEQTIRFAERQNPFGLMRENSSRDILNRTVDEQQIERI